MTAASGFGPVSISIASTDSGWRVTPPMVADVKPGAREQFLPGPGASARLGRCADFGRKAFTTASWVSTYGPPMRSMQ